ncbi:MAG: S8 family serine peptidase [Acidobacteria bacterium]|nr:S8 family serine peptidase [Acidobacteriota bacterium]
MLKEGGLISARKCEALMMIVALGFFLTVTVFSQARAPQAPVPQAPAENSYIVVLEQGVQPRAVIVAHGLRPSLIFSDALNGFATPASNRQVSALAADRRVKYIELDRVVSLVPPARPPVVRAQLHENNYETLTTGIDRIDAELNANSNVSTVGIAILDTGIWLKHSELNVVESVSFVRGTKDGNDDNGHGTHVAGISAARTNDSRGVRGVAPNARLFAVKVLDRSGSGMLSWVIKGVDWVTGKASAKQIHVANMSLGFEGTSTALNDAIHRMVTVANVSTTVAAGNSGKDASTFSPANHPDVITVSAMGDSDGLCGATGPPTSDGLDDTFANFSNFGVFVEIAAPGVDILSTWKGDRSNPGGLYASASGTSMSSPHTAGAAAQYVAAQLAAGITPTAAAVRQALLNRATPQGQSCGIDATGHVRGGFSSDKDSSAEPLVDASGF